MKKSILFIFPLLLLCTYCASQVPVALTPLPGPFLYTNGPNTGGALAFGCVFTFFAGTTTAQDTYTDASGMTKNQNPTVLNAGGFGQIWFISGSLYDVRVVSSGGTNCALGNTQYMAKSVNGSLLSLPNEWQQPQTFDLPISILAPDLQIVFGSPSGAQTTLDIPPTSSNFVLHGPPLTSDDTLLSADAIQDVQNKNLTTGTKINGCGVTNGPGTYICIPNNASTATTLNALAVLTGAPSTATVAPLSSPSVVGVVTAGAGIAGNATIQQTGIANCIFDGGTTAGDSVAPSTSVAGDCHDNGTGQKIGVVLSTNAAGGTFQVLFSASGGSGTSLACQNTTPVTVNANTTGEQVVLSCPVASGFNVAGKLFRVTANMLTSTSSSTSFVSLFINSGTGLVSYMGTTQSTSTTASYSQSFSIVCAVTVPGSSATIACTGPIGTVIVSGSPTLSVSNGSISTSGGDLTGTSFTIGTSCSFGVASVSNSCQGNELFVEQLN